jgi:hypothetical protein
MFLSMRTALSVYLATISDNFTSCCAWGCWTLVSCCLLLLLLSSPRPLHLSSNGSLGAMLLGAWCCEGLTTCCWALMHRLMVGRQCKG